MKVLTYIFVLLCTAAITFANPSGKKCPNNQVELECGSPGCTDRKCTDYIDGPCNLICLRNACGCPPERYINKDNKCVTLQECEKETKLKFYNKELFYQNS